MFKDKVSDKYNISIAGIWGTLECYGTYRSTLVRNFNTPIYKLDKRYIVYILFI